LDALNNFPEVRKTLLGMLKERPRGIRELSGDLGISYEGARQQVQILLKGGWIQRAKPAAKGAAGRPEAPYVLTEAGEHTFPKAYGSLSVELIDTLTERFGVKGLNEILASITQRKVAEWLPRMMGLSLKDRAELLKGVYFKDDPYMTVQSFPGGLRIVEKNCPFLEVARQRPAVCSVTVSALTALFGTRVEREQSFQAGNGCCSFVVRLDRPMKKKFVFEREKAFA
jgi:predicted ArsR family transcriptional regulator